MALSADYSIPVQVNGFACNNCTDVAYAKKHIDPAHPKSGPYDVNASADPSRVTQSVLLGGALAGARLAPPTAPPPKALGAFLDMSV